MDAIDFIRESAKYLAIQRPDIYDEAGAVGEISDAMEHLRHGNNTVETMMFGSFILVRIYEDEMEEFVLAKKVSGMLRCDTEEGVRTLSFDPSFQGLPYILDLDTESDL